MAVADYKMEARLGRDCSHLLDTDCLREVHTVYRHFVRVLDMKVQSAWSMVMDCKELWAREVSIKPELLPMEPFWREQLGKLLLLS